MQPCTLVCCSRYDVPFKICGRIAAVLGIVQSIIWLICACVILYWTPDSIFNYAPKSDAENGEVTETVITTGTTKSGSTTSTTTRGWFWPLFHPRAYTHNGTNLNIDHYDTTTAISKMFKLLTSELKISTGSSVTKLFDASKEGEVTTEELKEDGFISDPILEATTKELIIGANDDNRTIKYDLVTDGDVEFVYPGLVHDNQTTKSDNNIRSQTVVNIIDKTLTDTSDETMNTTFGYSSINYEIDAEVIGYSILIHDNETGSTEYIKLINDSLLLPGTFSSNSSFVQSGKNITIIKYFKPKSRTEPTITTLRLDEYDTISPKYFKTHYKVKFRPEPASIPADIFNKPTKTTIFSNFDEDYDDRIKTPLVQSDKTVIYEKLVPTMELPGRKSYDDDNYPSTVFKDEELFSYFDHLTTKISSLPPHSKLSTTPHLKYKAEQPSTKQYEILPFTTEPTVVTFIPVDNKLSSSLSPTSDLSTTHLTMYKETFAFENHSTTHEKEYNSNPIISRKGTFQEYPDRKSHIHDNYRTYINIPTTFVNTFKETYTNYKGFDKPYISSTKRTTKSPTKAPAKFRNVYDYIDYVSDDDESDRYKKKRFHPKLASGKKGIFQEYPGRKSHNNDSYRTLKYHPTTLVYEPEEMDSSVPLLKYSEKSPQFENNSKSFKDKTVKEGLLHRTVSTPVQFHKEDDSTDQFPEDIGKHEQGFHSKSAPGKKGTFQEYPGRISHFNDNYRTLIYLPTTLVYTSEETDATVPHLKAKGTFSQLENQSKTSKNLANERFSHRTDPTRKIDDDPGRFPVDQGIHRQGFHAKAAPGEKSTFQEYPTRNSDQNENYHTFNYIPTTIVYTSGKIDYTVPHFKYKGIIPLVGKHSTRLEGKTVSSKTFLDHTDPIPVKFRKKDYDIDRYPVDKGKHEQGFQSKSEPGKKGTFQEYPTRNSDHNEKYHTFNYIPTTIVYTSGEIDYTVPHFKYKGKIPLVGKHSTHLEGRTVSSKTFLDHTDPIPVKFRKEDYDIDRYPVDKGKHEQGFQSKSEPGKKGTFQEYPTRNSDHNEKYHTFNYIPTTIVYASGKIDYTVPHFKYKGKIPLVGKHSTHLEGRTVSSKTFLDHTDPIPVKFRKKDYDIDRYPVDKGKHEQGFQSILDPGKKGTFQEYPRRNSHHNENYLTLTHLATTVVYSSKETNSTHLKYKETSPHSKKPSKSFKEEPATKRRVPHPTRPKPVKFQNLDDDLGLFPVDIGKHIQGFHSKLAPGKKGTFQEYPKRNSHHNENYRTLTYLPTTLFYASKETDSLSKSYKEKPIANEKFSHTGPKHFKSRKKGDDLGVFPVDIGIHEQGFHSKLAPGKKGTFQEYPNRNSRLNENYHTFKNLPTTLVYTSKKTDTIHLKYRGTFPHFKKIFKSTTKEPATKGKLPHRTRPKPAKFHKIDDDLGMFAVDIGRHVQGFRSKAAPGKKGSFREYPKRNSNLNEKYHTFAYTDSLFKSYKEEVKFRKKSDDTGQYPVDIGKHEQGFYSKSYSSKKDTFQEHPRRNRHSNENYLSSTLVYKSGETDTYVPYLKHKETFPQFEKHSESFKENVPNDRFLHRTGIKKKMIQKEDDEIGIFPVDIGKHEQGFYPQSVIGKKSVFYEYPRRPYSENYRTFKYMPTTLVDKPEETDLNLNEPDKFSHLGIDQKNANNWTDMTVVTSQNNDNIDRFPTHQTAYIPQLVSSMKGIFQEYPDRKYQDNEYRTFTEFPTTYILKYESDLNTDKTSLDFGTGETRPDETLRVDPIVVTFQNKVDDDKDLFPVSEGFPKGVSSKSIFYEYPERKLPIEETYRTFNYLPTVVSFKVIPILTIRPVEDFDDFGHRKLFKQNLYYPNSKRMKEHLIHNADLLYTTRNIDQETLPAHLFPNDPNILYEDTDDENLGKQMKKITRKKRHDTTLSIWDKVNSLVSRKNEIEKQSEKSPKNWVLDFMEKLPTVMSNFTPETKPKTEPVSTTLIAFNHSNSTEEILSTLITDKQNSIPKQLYQNTVETSTRSNLTAKYKIKDTFSTLRNTESIFENINDENTTQSQTDAKEKVHTTKYDIGINNFNHDFNRHVPAIFARSNGHRKAQIKPYTSPLRNLFFDHYLRMNTKPFLPNFAMCYMPLMILWFVVSVLLCLMIQCNRLPTPNTRCTLFTYFLWSIVTLAVCILDLIVTMYIIDDGFVNLIQKLPTEKSPPSRLKRHIENLYKFTDDDTTASTEYDFYFGLIPIKLNDTTEMPNFDYQNAFEPQTHFHFASEPSVISKAAITNRSEDKKYESQVVRVQLIAMLSLFTLRFVIFWLINLFLATLLLASICSWRDEWFCNYRCKIMKSEINEPCWPINSCESFDPNINYICKNYPPCVPENPCFQPEPFYDKDYCNDSELVCEDGRYIPSAPPPNDIYKEYKENVPCIYCGQSILNCTDENHICQDCQKKRKLLKNCVRCGKYPQCSPKTSCCLDCDKRLKGKKSRMDILFGHNHKPCLLCRVDKLPCRHVNTTCNGCRSNVYPLRRKTREISNNPIRSRLSSENPTKMYHTNKVSFGSMPKLKGHSNTSSSTNTPVTHNGKNDTKVNEEIKQEVIPLAHTSPRRFRTFAPIAPNITFKLLRKIFNEDESM